MEEMPLPVLKLLTECCETSLAVHALHKEGRLTDDQCELLCMAIDSLNKDIVNKARG